MWRRLTCLTLLACVTAVPRAHAQQPAFAPTTHTTVAGARGAVSVDLNRDGWLDIATANVGRNTVAILLNGGAAGGFLAPREIAVGAGPFDIAAGDLDRDGVPDLAVVTASAPPGVEVLLMNNDATLKRRTIVSTVESRGIAIADITRDGVLDLVFSDYGRNRVVALPGDGGGGFRPLLAWGVGPRPQGVSVADFNHDGFMDIAVALTNGTVLTVLEGTATTSVRPRSYSAGRTLNVLAAADINDDGWLDIAAASTGTNAVSFFKGSATGFFLAGTRGTGSSPRGIASGDFNHDGRPDFAVSNRGSSSVRVFVARRDGSVVPDRWGELPAGSGARGTVAGDFDNDGRTDMGAAAELAPSLTMFVNDTAFVRPGFSFRREPMKGGFAARVATGDFNENGLPDLLKGHSVVLDGATVVPLRAHRSDELWGVAAADMNRDGHLDTVVAVDELRGFKGFEVHHGDGRGGFTFQFGIGGLPGLFQFRIADIDRNGYLDVVGAGNRGGQPRLFVFRQLSATESRVDEYPLDYSATVDLADVNRDGILDLLLGGTGVLGVRFGNGAGQFAGGSDLPLDTDAHALATGDLNHDGRLDVVRSTGETVLVVLGRDGGEWQPPARFPADAPGSSFEVTLGDFNQDGHLDVFAGNVLLPGNGDGTLGAPAAFDINACCTVVDWNRDGLPDLVGDAEAVLSERRAVNRPPVADPGPDRTLEYADQFEEFATELVGSGSRDPDAHRLSYEWRDESGALMSTEFFAFWQIQPPGTYTFTLTVRDGRGGEASDSVVVTIEPTAEIVRHTEFPVRLVGWQEVADATAAAHVRTFYPDAGAAKVTTPLANPPAFVELDFIADPTQTYKLWVRLKAQNNRGRNDSIWVQFTNAIDVNGNPNYRIGTTEGLAVNLEECLGCGVSGWGWEDDGWGAVNKNGTLLRFREGFQRIRIQVREDGVSVDQIVLSAVKYRTTRPGLAKNDATILAATYVPE